MKRRVVAMTSMLLAAAATAQLQDQPCTRIQYPSFLDLPPAAAAENLPTPDPSGIGRRWRRLIQTALRPNPKDFSWYQEYGTWVCRFQQGDQVMWHSFPPEANSAELVGTLVEGRLLIAPVAALMQQGMQASDPRPFSDKDLVLAETTRHPKPPQ
jgi:hypothetical protein